MAISPGRLYAVTLVDYISGGHKVHDEVFTNEESAKVFTSTLEKPVIGFIVPVNINYM